MVPNVNVTRGGQNSEIDLGLRVVKSSEFLVVAGPW